MNLEWMNERIPRMRKGNWLYNLICFVCGRRKQKLTYKEYMMITYDLNKKKLGDREAKEASVNKALEIYMWLNKKLPDLGEKDDE